MISTMRLFAIIIQLLCIVLSLSTMYIFGIRKNGEADADFFKRLLKLVRRITIILLAMGWILGAPTEIEGFVTFYKYIGILWFVLGAFYLCTLLVGKFAFLGDKGQEEKALLFIWQFGVSNIVYGLIMTFVTWFLLMGY